MPFDQEWLWGTSLLAETVALLDDVGSAAVLYPLLLPWANLAAADHPEGFRGSMFRYLGLLAAMIGRTDEAARHFESAIAKNAEMGVRPWLARSQLDYARLLLEDGRRTHATELVEAAEALAEELGLRVPPVERIAARSERSAG